MSLRQLGRYLGSPSFRGRVLLVGWVGALGFLLFRAAEVQLRDASAWRAEAERQHRAQGALPAPRGSILDREGAPLAQSREAFRVSVAPHEVADREGVAERLVEALGISASEARRITTSERRWVQLPGLYPPRAREALAQLRGVHLERVLTRSHPHGDLARGILGAVIDDLGAGGIEQAFESHLVGIPGSQVVGRDSEGRPIPGESWVIQPPVAGGDVVLTLDRDLQEIAQAALLDAIAETGARGGDLLVTDPRTGEILAMVSIQDGSTNFLSGITTPFEPGSTLKPFVVAGLLELDRVSLADSVDTGDGRWQVAGRTISDVSRVGKVTLAHALRVSSNVAMAKLADRYTPSEQYELLRDFGFGLPTGVPLPGEATGTLRHPRHWSRQSSVSLAIGYEMAATPLQMAMAYGALANGGLLLEPRLVREVRAPDGRPLEQLEPRVVRRVISEGTAAQVNRTLVEAVEDGTGSRARLATFQVAGKSGTARATGPDGRYESGAYFASFVGFFPAERPQLVVFVKLDRPRGTYFGGATAAPVTRATMEAVLAARHSPLDREALATLARKQEEERRLAAEEAARLAFLEAYGEEGTAQEGSPGGTGSQVLPAGRGGSANGQAGGTTRGMPGAGAPAIGGGTAGYSIPPRGAVGIPALLASWEAHSGALAREARSATAPGMEVLVPEVQGLSARSAIRRLHSLGLHVSWDGEGSSLEGARLGTVPRAGAQLQAGDTVRLVPTPEAASGRRP
jgi:cell division protein FtsI (penicillin-binding protein 3)